MHLKILTYFPHFGKNKRILMRLPYCLRVSVSLLPTPESSESGARREGPYNTVT
jgi:hypothetical protein